MVASVQEFFAALIGADDGLVEPDRVAHRLRATKPQLAEALGLSEDAVFPKGDQSPSAAQARLRDLVEIVGQVEAWAGTGPRAFAWYRSQPLPSFGGLTAEALVKQGRASAVKSHLARIGVGGYA
ncbi:XRE family transcriptional regulator [Azospirillum sp. SYSU D00513]|uniref:XRE family transcriptional regulator n=1 Tax=Azospirillum sp. SYSU D00513 TaxID=2812561 RepID=UPI001A97C166|nr:XRE family transcriptional regulator [Azospirillum sp. SYSU D00513]